MPPTIIMVAGRGGGGRGIGPSLCVIFVCFDACGILDIWYPVPAARLNAPKSPMSLVWEASSPSKVDFAGI